MLRTLVVHPDAETLLPLLVDASHTPAVAPGELLRMVRTSLRMSQGQLARRSSIDQAHIVRIESGRIDAQWKTLEKLFAALGCQLAPHVRVHGGLEKILEDQIHKRAQLNVERGERLWPSNPPLSDVQLLTKEQEWAETLRNRHTSEIWDEDSQP